MNIVETWLDNVAYSHSRSKSTRENYRFYLQKFCGFIQKTPEEILEHYERLDSERKFKRKYAMLVKAFISDNLNKYATCSIRTMICAVSSFFKYNDLPLGHVPIAKPQITYHNRDITKEEIVSILDVASARQRAFFCMMTQSGLRPYTLCRLKFKHILPDYKKRIPCKVDVPQEIAKGKYGSYFTFTGEESIRYLESYFKDRKDIKPNDYLFTTHGTNRKVSKNSMSVNFANIIKKLNESGNIKFEQKKEGKPRTIRLYSLRKWFRKQAGFGAGQDYVNFWMGHSLGVDDHYFSRDVEHHRQVYREKAMPHLRLERTTTVERDEIQKLKAQMKDLQKEVEKWKRYFDVSVRHRLHDLAVIEEAEEQAFQDEQRKMDERLVEEIESARWEQEAQRLADEIKKRKQRG